MTKKGSKETPKDSPIKVKVFRVTGEIIKPNLQTSFHKEVRATKPEEVVERVYKELGSRHRAKRFQIKISKVEEINPDEIEDPVIRKLTLGEEESVK
ncbi:MAG: 50S ribosomal protein L18Ae [Candidatus Bathyarchaeia archaeon]